MKHPLAITALLLATACTDGGTVEPTWITSLELSSSDGLGGLVSADVQPISDGSAYVVAPAGNFGVFLVEADGRVRWGWAPRGFTTVDSALRGDHLLLYGSAQEGAAFGEEPLDTEPGPVVLEIDPAGQIVATTRVGEADAFPQDVAAMPGGGFALVTFDGSDGGTVVLSFRDAAGEVTFEQVLGNASVAADLAVDPIGGDVFVIAGFGEAFVASPDVVLGSGGGAATALARYGPDGTLRFARQSLGTGTFEPRFVGSDVVLQGFGSRVPFVLGFDGTPVSKPSLVQVDPMGETMVTEQLREVLHPSLRDQALIEVGAQYREGELRVGPGGPVALEVDRVLGPNRRVDSIVTVRRLDGPAGVADLSRHPGLSTAAAHPTSDAVWLTMNIGADPSQLDPNPYGTGFVIVSFPL